MIKTDLVSIIIPVYNGEKYIEKCLNSILSQTYKNIEVIIINDGSTDNTKKILEKFYDSRVKKVHIKNGGVSNARNLGISSSNGKYLMFIDADDYLENNAIEKLYETIQEYEVDIIRFNGYVQKSNKIFTKIEFPVENKKILDSKDDSKEIIELLNFPSKSLRCYSPLLFMKNENIISFNTELCYLEDKLFYIENMLNNKKVLFLDECYYYYVYNTDSKTKGVDGYIENICDLLKSKKYIINVVEKYGYKDIELLNSSYGLLIMYRIDFFVENQNYKSTRKLLVDIFDIEIISDSLNFNIKYLKKYKKIQYLLLKNKMYLLFYIFTKLKNIKKN